MLYVQYMSGSIRSLVVLFAFAERVEVPALWHTSHYYTTVKG